jgi:hypothetical protein
MLDIVKLRTRRLSSLFPPHAKSLFRRLFGKDCRIGQGFRLSHDFVLRVAEPGRDRPLAVNALAGPQSSDLGAQMLKC